ncbi:MAG: choice-of-anchor D domain-containing protein [Solirubrobacteraceae bacterium]
MYSTLVYEAPKAVIEEGLRKAAPAQHQPLEARRPAAGRFRRGVSRGAHRRLRVVVGLLALIGSTVLTFASSALADLPQNCGAGGSTVTCLYQYTGSEQTFTVPSGVDSVQVSAAGAIGGGRLIPGGAAAIASTEVPVRPGEVLYVEVGGAGQQVPGPTPGGWNGGGGAPGGGGGGGGASDVRTVPCGSACPGDVASLGSRLVVAGGGGGAGIGPFAGAGGIADYAGGDDTGSGGGGGRAGNLAGGGSGGAGAPSNGPLLPGVAGNNGTFGQGGASSGDHVNYPGSGGGGGGGYYGGGAGGSGQKDGFDACQTNGGVTTCPPDPAGGGGGGGGSSYAPGGAIAVDRFSDPAHVTITYGFPAASPSAQSVTFAAQPQATLSASQPVTVTNTGGASLRVTGLTFSGDDAGDFAVTSDDCRGNTIDAGNSCFVNVGFAPQATGQRSAALVIESNDPLSPATVSLSGIGSGLPTGPQGPTGAPGPIGPSGPQGPPGPVGKVICNSTGVAQLLCSIIFPSGTWSTAHATVRASYDITRHGRTVASGWIRLHNGRVTLRSRRLPAGRYALTVTIITGHQRVILLHRSVIIPRTR